jgi:hypothetical protein
MRLRGLLGLAALLIASRAAAQAPAGGKPDLPKVVLIGDSIRLGYAPAGRYEGEDHFATSFCQRGKMVSKRKRASGNPLRLLRHHFATCQQHVCPAARPLRIAPLPCLNPLPLPPIPCQRPGVLELWEIGGTFAPTSADNNDLTPLSPARTPTYSCDFPLLQV